MLVVVRWSGAETNSWHFHSTRHVCSNYWSKLYYEEIVMCVYIVAANRWIQMYVLLHMNNFWMETFSICWRQTRGQKWYGARHLIIRNLVKCPLNPSAYEISAVYFPRSLLSLSTLLPQSLLCLSPRESLARKDQSCLRHTCIKEFLFVDPGG